MLSENPARKDVMDAIETALMDGTIQSDERYRPSLIFNDEDRKIKVKTSLISEMERCTAFDFSVAFVTMSGITPLFQKFDELRMKGIKGRIITTDYLNFSDPDALKWFLNHSDIEVRVYEKDNFHTKGYIFRGNESVTLIIGSSNLTSDALVRNKEWNLKITSLEDGLLVDSVSKEFQQMWSDATPLTEQWIEEYRPRHMRAKMERDEQIFTMERHGAINPNAMQKEALIQLDSLRRQGRDKALLISATGTGKTFLSAFDVRASGSKKVLFLVHREQILDDAKDRYKQILGSKFSYGKLSGTSKDYDADVLFSTINTMSKSDVLARFDSDHFDYIVCDEAHHTTAKMYESILGHFKAKFMLGMTATPERMDQADVFRMFDYNIAYELRLQKAMEMNMLCPFHYFGIADISVNGKVLDDEDSKNNFKLLTSDERVRHIVEKAEYFSHSGNRVKGLIFCSRNDEAKILSEKLNSYNLRTIALSGANTMKEREDAARRLEQDEGGDCLDYILTCDIFNEGVDIPKINQILMLRPTESAMIFIQQLGRGLRKAKGKDYAVVIDFIGNYNNNFLIPIALSGDRTCSKDSIRKYVISGNDVIPGCSSVNFDEITKERIFDNINKTTISKLRTMKNEYLGLKMRLGRSPTLTDLYNGGSLDPRVLIDYSDNLNEFRSKIKDDGYKILTQKENDALSFVSTMFLNGKRPHELAILKEAIENGEIPIEPLVSRYGKESVDSALSILSGGYVVDNVRKKFHGCVLIERMGDMICPGRELRESLGNPVFSQYLEDVIGCGLDINSKEYSKVDEVGLVPFEKYSRADVCRILNWKSDESSVMYGYRVKYNTCPIFVTYNKSEDISETTKYDDRFVNRQLFSWMTRSGATLNSPDVKAIKDSERTGMKIPLFVKKSDGEGRDFYYLGLVDPVTKDMCQTTIGNSSVVNIPMRLRSAVRNDVYDYLIA